MRWLIAAIIELIHWATGRRRGGNGFRQGRGLDAGALERENALDGVRTHGGHRVREVYVLGPRASHDGIGLDDDRIQFMDENAVQWDVRFREIRSCDCGALIGFGNSLLGVCRCGRTVCQQKGCGHRCQWCGSLACSTHSVRSGERCFCLRHSWCLLWLRFWGA